MSTKQSDTFMLFYSLKGYYLLECSVRGEWGCGSIQAEESFLKLSLKWRLYFCGIASTANHNVS